VSPSWQLSRESYYEKTRNTERNFLPAAWIFKELKEDISPRVPYVKIVLLFLVLPFL
jgi:hypothetical protein